MLKLQRERERERRASVRSLPSKTSERRSEA